MNWPLVSLGSIAKIQTGKSNKEDAIPNGEYAFFDRSQDVQRSNRFLLNTEAVIVPGEGMEFIPRYFVGPFDFHQRVYAITNFQGVNGKFLYYALTHKRKYFAQVAIGTTVKSLRMGMFERFAFNCPPMETQLRIASILSAYDDLIENNRRRIQLLEQSTRLLYKEWFVHHRFPGHEHTPITNGIPAGWEETAVSEIATVSRGKSYRSFELLDAGGKDFVNLKCLQRFGGFRISGLKHFEGEHREHHCISANDIVIALTDMTRDAMVVAQAARVPRSIGDGAVFSMDLAKITPRPEVDPNWLYLLFRHSGFSFAVREHATGTTVLHLKPKYIEEWKMPLPPAKLRNAFSEIVGPVLAQQDLLESQCGELARARDIILPRLMSGEITT